MWPYIIGEPTESGEVDMKMEVKEEEEEKEKTNTLKNLTLVVWGAEKLRRKKDVFGSAELDGELQRQRHPDGTVSWAGQRIG